MIANNFNDLYKMLIRDVLINGKEQNPRGIITRELTAFTYILTDISKSLLTLKEMDHMVHE